MYNSKRFRGSPQQNRQQARFEYHSGNNYQASGALADMNFPQMLGSFQQSRSVDQQRQPEYGNYPQQRRQSGMPLRQQCSSPHQGSMGKHQKEVMRHQRMFLMQQQQQRKEENYLKIQQEKQMRWRLQERKVQEIQTRIIDRQQLSQRKVIASPTSSLVNSSREPKTMPDYHQGKIASTSNILVHCSDNKTKAVNSPKLASERKPVLNSKSPQSSINAKNLIDLSPGKTNMSKSPRISSQTKISSSQTGLEGTCIQPISNPIRQTDGQTDSETNERQRVIVEIIIEDTEKKIEEVGAVDNIEAGKLQTEELLLESRSLVKERERQVAKRSIIDSLKELKKRQATQSESKLEKSFEIQTVDNLEKLTVTDIPDLESEVLVLKHMSKLDISNANDISVDTEVKGALHGQDLSKGVGRKLIQDQSPSGLVKDLQEGNNSAKTRESPYEITEDVSSFVNVEKQEETRAENKTAKVILAEDATEKGMASCNSNTSDLTCASQKIVVDIGGEKTSEHKTDLEVNDTEETLCQSGGEDSAVGRIGVIKSAGISSADIDLVNKNNPRTSVEDDKDDSEKVSLMTGCTISDSEVEKTVASSPEDVNDIIDKIDKILVDNASVVNSGKHYEVLTEAISDEEFENNIEGNYTAPDTVFVADARKNILLINDNTSELGNFRNLNSNQSDELIKVQLELQLKSKGSESSQVQASDTDVKNIKNGEDYERNIEVHEKAEEDTAVTGDGNKGKKSYIECMEVEDISPPLSIEPEHVDSLTGTNGVYKDNDFEITSSFSKAENLTCKIVEEASSMNLRVNNSITHSESSNMREDTVTELNVDSSDYQIESQICHREKDDKITENNNSSQTDVDEEKMGVNEIHHTEQMGGFYNSMDIDLATTPNLPDEQNVDVDKMTSEEGKEPLKTHRVQESASGCVVELERLEDDTVQRLSRPSSQETSNKFQRLNSQSSQESVQDRGRSQSWLLGSDEEDDDLLDTIPAFLQSVQEISDRPLPSTPEHLSTPSHSQDSNEDHGERDTAAKTETTKPPALKSRFSLDDLLQDREKSTSAEQKRIDEIHSECKKDIQEGGFITFLDRVEEETTEELALPEENQQILNQLNVEESQISDDRPGRCVFDRARYCCLFGETLHPTHCGFSVGGGKYIEKHLESLLLDQYQRLLTTGIIQMTFEKVQCQGQLMRWLFFLMSIHSDYLIRHGCHKIMMDILHTQQLKGKQKWCPAVADVLTVFVNYGATLDGLLVSSNLWEDTLQTELFQQPNHTPTATHRDHYGYNIDNLMLVLEVLAYSLKDISSHYTCAELTVLLTTLMTVSLDTKLESFCAFDAFSICVHNVLHQYPEAEWNNKKISICRLISQVSSHHHDKLVVAQLLPMDARGSYLQRRTSFLMLQVLCDVDEKLEDEELDKLQIQNLYQFVSYMKELVHTDPYKLSSVITLMDLSVGNNSSLSSTEREELRCLMDQVKRLSGEVRDNVRMLDQTRVKDMMFRVTSRWSLDIQATKGKQSKIFEYVKRTPKQIRVETVQTVQSNEESEDSDSEFEPDCNQEQAPCKMPRLEPYVDETLETSPKLCDDSSHISEPDCFNWETDKAVRDNVKSGSAADTDYNCIDDDDDLPEL